MHNTEIEEENTELDVPYSRLLVNVLIGKHYYKSSFVMAFNNPYATTAAILGLIELGAHQEAIVKQFTFRYAYKDIEDIFRVTVEYEVKSEEEAKAVLGLVDKIAETALPILPHGSEADWVPPEELKDCYTEYRGKDFISMRVALDAKLDFQFVAMLYGKLLTRLKTYLIHVGLKVLVIPYMTENSLKLDPAVLAPTSIVDYDYEEGTYFIGVSFKALNPAFVDEMKELFKAFIGEIGEMDKPVGGLH